MGPEALRLEPGFENAPASDVKRFDAWATHETARVGILGQLGPHSTLLESLQSGGKDLLAFMIENVEKRCELLAREYADGSEFIDPGKWCTGKKFQFSMLAARLRKLGCDIIPDEIDNGVGTVCETVSLATVEAADPGTQMGLKRAGNDSDSNSDSDSDSDDSSVSSSSGSESVVSSTSGV